MVLTTGATLGINAVPAAASADQAIDGTPHGTTLPFALRTERNGALTIARPLECIGTETNVASEPLMERWDAAIGRAPSGARVIFVFPDVIRS
jgi:hypothetical protein